MSFCVVVNNSVEVNVGDDVIVNREGVRVIIDCTQLIDNIGVQNPTVNWYKDGVIIAYGSAVNVVTYFYNRLCVITKTLLHGFNQVGTSGNYTCKVCDGTTNCISKKSTHVVCGKKDHFNNYMFA